MIKYFEFETKIEKIETILNQLNNNKELNDDRIKKLDKEKEQLYKKIYSNLDPWQKVQVSRHGERPHTLDYTKQIFDDIVLLHGDKKYADDNAIVGGLAEIDNKVLKLKAELFSDDGKDSFNCEVIGNILDPFKIGKDAGEKLLSLAGSKFKKK